MIILIFEIVLPTILFIATNYGYLFISNNYMQRKSRVSSNQILSITSSIVAFHYFSLVMIYNYNHYLGILLIILNSIVGFVYISEFDYYKVINSNIYLLIKFLSWILLIIGIVLIITQI